MDWLTYANQGAIRNDPLNPRLIDALSFLPELGVTVQVFSGGQDASGPNRTGSTRHNDGNAADVFFFKDGRKLDWANPEDRPIFEQIVQRGKAAGITGFGAGPGYMQSGSMHLGFGTPAVWGAGGRGANAPAWLKAAYNGGVAVPPANDTPYSPALPRGGAGTSMGGFMGGPSQVAARNPVIQTAALEGTGDFRPTNFQRMEARKAMEGDQSQRARLLQAAGLDPTGKTRLSPRSTQAGILSKLMEGLKLPTAEEEQKKQNPFGILGNIFNLFG